MNDRCRFMKDEQVCPFSFKGLQCGMATGPETAAQIGLMKECPRKKGSKEKQKK